MEEEDLTQEVVCDDEEYWSAEEDWSAEEEGFTDCFSHEPDNTQESTLHHVLTQQPEPLSTKESTQPPLPQDPVKEG